MLGEDPLDLGAVDVLAAADDHVLEPVLDVDVAVGVDLAEVAGAEPAVLGDHLRGRLGLAEEALHQLRRTEPQLAVLAGRDVLEGARVDDPDLGARDGLPGADQPLGVVGVAVGLGHQVGDHAADLGEPVAPG